MVALERNGKLITKKTFQLTDVDIGSWMARRMMKLAPKKLGSSETAINIFEQEQIEQWVVHLHEGRPYVWSNEWVEGQRLFGMHPGQTVSL